MSRSRTKSLRYLACVALACAAACALAISVAQPASGQRAPRTFTLIGAGDIARCDSKRDEATARIVQRIRGTVFTLGDNVQGTGAAREFSQCYNPSWGRFKKRTRPAVGNHEYDTSGAKPYYNYFRTSAGPRGRGYYTYKRGGWRVVVLNSNCDFVRCDPKSPQARWLKNILKRNSTRCTVAMFHHPLFSTNAATPAVRPLWRILYNNRADLILNGHAHSYERFAPQRPDGTRDNRRGIRQIVAGTGGAQPIDPFGPRPKNSVVRNDKTPGVLRLNLKNGSYNWRFIPVAGRKFTDSGSGRCR